MSCGGGLAQGFENRRLKENHHFHLKIRTTVPLILFCQHVYQVLFLPLLLSSLTFLHFLSFFFFTTRNSLFPRIGTKPKHLQTHQLLCQRLQEQGVQGKRGDEIGCSSDQFNEEFNGHCDIETESKESKSHKMVGARFWER